VSWASAEGFGQGPWTSLPGNFSGVGRCSALAKNPSKPPKIPWFIMVDHHQWEFQDPKIEVR